MPPPALPPLNVGRQALDWAQQRLHRVGHIGGEIDQRCVWLSRGNTSLLSHLDDPPVGAATFRQCGSSARCAASRSACGPPSMPCWAWCCLVQLSLPAGSAVRASSWAWSKLTSAAVALAVTSSSVSAPTITEATAGRDSSQASDTWYGCKPHSRLSRSTARPISSSGPVNPDPPNLLSPENSRSSTCMPASSPPCSGPNGTMDSPNC